MTGVAALLALAVSGGQFVDGGGGVVLLRGVNVAGDAKVPPFRPATPAIFDALPALGVNVVRLIFTWEAYEPSPGAYDDSYLTYYIDAVRAATARGIYVVVDFHQDAFSRSSLEGCGEGFPAWALPPTITPATPDNGADCSDWGARMISDATLAQTWDGFYADAGGARTAYIAMVGRVAAALAGEGVAGYDLMNEPGGDEVTQLAPLYADAGAAIRAGDPNAILFVSPRALTSSGAPTKLPQPSFQNIAFSPHYYDATLYLLGSWNGTPADDNFTQMRATATAWGAALFVGEYGTPPSTENGAGYIDMLGGNLDRLLASGAQWAYTPGWTPAKKDGWNLEDFSIVDDTGALRANFRPRPTAQRISGAATAQTVSDVELRLDWTNDPATGATQLFAPASWFGGTTRVDADGDVTCTTAGDTVTCMSPTAGPKTVRVVPPPRCGLGGELLVAIFLARAVSSRRGRRESVRGHLR